MWLLLSAGGGLSLAALVSASFVLSLYVWRSATTTDRDHPQVIRQRITSTATVSLLCAPLLYAVRWIPTETDLEATSSLASGGPPLSEWLGFPSLPLSYVPAVVLPLLLTASLFLGPLVVLTLTACRSSGSREDDESSLSKVTSYVGSRWRELWTQDEFWKSIRNLVAAPVAEEVVFRGSVLAFLVAGGWGFGSCVLLSPVLFGCAHLHHLLNHVRTRGVSVATGAMIVTFQLGYTTLFGAFASFVLLRTGHMTSAIVAHTFCNTMGFPELRFLSPAHPLYAKRHVLLAVFAAGIVLFTLGLYPLTDPTWYTTEGEGPWLLAYQAMRQQPEGAMANLTPNF